MNLPDFEGMAVFVKIVEAGSLSAAERLYGLPKATLSRQVVRLEQALGGPLLLKTPRGIRLTELGLSYLARCRPLVQDAIALQDEFSARSSVPSGRLRMSASVAYGRHVLAPLLFEFSRDYPLVHLDIEFTDRPVQMADEGFDLAVRMGTLPDSDLVSRRLGSVQRLLVASPAYVERAGRPQSPADLISHKCLLIRPEMRRWQFQGAEGAQSVPVVPSMVVRDMHAMKDAALAGLGVTILPGFLAGDALQGGLLVEVLPGWRLAPAAATALYQKTRTASPALSRLLEFLAARLQGRR
ncbi:LysR family transcriptional regulator [Noviherbaspirillum denitrificans]|uniref:HTH lysR-type domain-containing protein n=1 Tax=Noviherbaspirillum denitrificans TaxID=1968433 RepID=A0A254TDT3_9BURK|nr:LysR family transcriptional regulator [Noviherbaspirillum denitrificans]OWW20809.1 hypothetical protein AYR66_16370 [Noviherbaspirillum denitrificans]